MSRRARGGPPIELPPGARWITLSNKRRVLIDAEGRILRGLPDLFGRVHVQDLAAVGRGVREAERDAADCEKNTRRRLRRRFRTSEEAVRALLRANPDLVAFLESECSLHCEAYQQWIRHGRRGPKPLPKYGDGRFDAIEVPLDLSGKRAISSWIEAVHVVVPPSRRWEDFPERLQYLADATGLTLQLPGETERLQVQTADLGQCRDAADRRIDELLALARSTRLLPASGADDEVPF